MFRISLRTAVAALLLSVSVTVAVIAFVPLYNSATANAELLSDAYVGDIAIRLQAKVASFYSNANAQLDHVMDQINFGNMPLNDNATLLKTLAYLTHRAGFTVLYDFDNGVGWLSAVTINSFATAAVIPPGLALIAYDNNHYNDFVFYTYNLTTYAEVPVVLAPNFHRTVPYNHTLRPFYAPLRAKRSWAPIYVDIGEQYADLLCGGPVRDPATGEWGIVSILTTTNDLTNYLRNVQVASTGRIVLYDVPSKTFIGGNFPAPLVVRSNGSSVLAKLTDVTDPLMRSTLDALGAQLFVCATPCLFNLGIDDDEVFVFVEAVTDAYGLDLRILVAAPSNDFLADIRRSTRIGIGAVVGSVAALMAIGVLGLVFLLKPLRDLEEKLYRSAELSSEWGTDEKESIISEIHNIEVAYERLRAELKKVKSFLPQSVLRQLESNSDSDDGDCGEEMCGAVATSAQARHNPLFAPAVNSNRSVATEQTSFPSVVVISSTAAAEALVQDEESGVSVNNPPGDHSTAAEGYASVSGEGMAHIGSAQDSMNDSDSQQQVVGKSVTIETTSGKSSVVSHPMGRRGTRGSAGLRKTPMLDINVYNRRITVVMGNLCGFHALLDRIGYVALQQVHAGVMECILNNVNRFKGVVDSFHGDRVAISFNASATCNLHGQRAGAAMCAMRGALRRFESPLLPADYSPVMRFGAATGNAFCGNYGPLSMRRFSVVGVVVGHAFALMQQTKLENVLNLVSSASFELMTTAFVVQHVNLLLLPQSAGGSLVSTIIGRNGNSDNDCFHQSESSCGDLEGDCAEVSCERAKLTAAVNEAFESLSRGNVPRAREIVVTLPASECASLQRCLRAVSLSMKRM